VAARHRAQEQGRIEDLDVDAEGIHMGQAGAHIVHLAGLLGGVGADVLVLVVDPGVDHPEFAALLALVVQQRVAEGLGGDRGQVLAIGLVHVLPGGRRFDDVGVGIDDRRDARNGGGHGLLLVLIGFGETYHGPLPGTSWQRPNRAENAPPIGDIRAPPDQAFLQSPFRLP